MKKHISMILAFAIVLSCISLMGCHSSSADDLGGGAGVQAPQPVLAQTLLAIGPTQVQVVEEEEEVPQTPQMPVINGFTVTLEEEDVEETSSIESIKTKWADAVARAEAGEIVEVYYGLTSHATSYAIVNDYRHALGCLLGNRGAGGGDLRLDFDPAKVMLVRFGDTGTYTYLVSTGTVFDVALVTGYDGSTAYPDWVVVRMESSGYFRYEYGNGGFNPYHEDSGESLFEYFESSEKNVRFRLHVATVDSDPEFDPESDAFECAYKGEVTAGTEEARAVMRGIRDEVLVSLYDLRCGKGAGKYQHLPNPVAHNYYGRVEYFVPSKSGVDFTAFGSVGLRLLDEAGIDTGCSICLRLGFAVTKLEVGSIVKVPVLFYPDDMLIATGYQRISLEAIPDWWKDAAELSFGK